MTELLSKLSWQTETHEWVMARLEVGLVQLKEPAGLTTAQLALSVRVAQAEADIAALKKG
jgi:hypothetical protein